MPHQAKQPMRVNGDGFGWWLKKLLSLDRAAVWLPSLFLLTQLTLAPILQG